jgi:hypothetical protein
MSEISKLVIAAGSNRSDADNIRRQAVAAAAEIIAAFVASGNPGASLSDEMGKLSSYADAIQEALKAK